MSPASALVDKFVKLIINPAILIVFALGFFLFMWGLVQFMRRLEEVDHANEGKQHMLWGIVGMLIMISVYGIIHMIDGTFGLNISNPDTSEINNIPSVNIGGQ